jgi:hypothetical protein
MDVTPETIFFNDDEQWAIAGLPPALSIGRVDVGIHMATAALGALNESMIECNRMIDQQEVLEPDPVVNYDLLTQVIVDKEDVLQATRDALRSLKDQQATLLAAKKRRSRFTVIEGTA